jgi:hypothetical protein
LGQATVNYSGSWSVCYSTFAHWLHYWGVAVQYTAQLDREKTLEQQQLDRANLIDQQQQTTLETYLDGPLCTDSVRKGRPEAQTVWLQVGGWAVRLVRFEKVRLPISHAKCDGRVMGKLLFVTAM